MHWVFQFFLKFCHGIGIGLVRYRKRRQRPDNIRTVSHDSCSERLYIEYIRVIITAVIVIIIMWMLFTYSCTAARWDAPAIMEVEKNVL